MKTPAVTVIAMLACIAPSAVRGAPLATVRLDKKQDAFFIENDFVYRRLLQLARDGTYRQINSERTGSTEVDRGTWEQSADGTVLLHFTRGGLRFHALSSGPLSITLSDPPEFTALPAAASAIRHWLAPGYDAVFATPSAAEIATTPFVIAVDPNVESFRREDLVALARRIDDFVWTEQHQTFRFVPWQIPGGVLLLIQQGAVFQAADLPRVLAEYPIKRGQPPPFYFARVNAGTFAREAGNWQELR